MQQQSIDVNAPPPSFLCRYERPAGLLITVYVYIVYLIALRFEGPFTDMIYSTKAAADAAKANGQSKKEL